MFLILLLFFVCMMPIRNTQAEETYQYFQESLAELENPERGFYEPVGMEMKVSDNKIPNIKGNLIHLRVGIGAFSKAVNGEADIPFTQDMLDALDGTLKDIKGKGGSVIIRFAYDDFEGKGDLEPSMDMMLVHINQLKPVFERNADAIAYVELGFFGPWGEMHTSELCTTENVSMALDAMLKIVPRDITIGVRTPRYYAKWAKVEREQLDLDFPQEGSEAYRVGLYNDGYLGSESDLGTFSNREIETTWLSNQARHTFYGGEVVANFAEGEPLNTVAYLSKEAFKTHTTYLNRYWNDTVIESWKEEIYQGEDARYQGQSGYLYVVNHLGYRFVLRQCKMDEQVQKGQTFHLNMKLENVGFANLINSKKISLLLQGEKNCYEIATDIDPRKWNSTQITEIQTEIQVPEDMDLGAYHVYLRISKYGDCVSDNNYQCIQLANDGIWNTELGANRIGSICVLEKEAGTKPDKPGETLEDKPGGTPEVPEKNQEETLGNKLEETPEISGENLTEEPGSDVTLVKKITLNGSSHKIAAGKKIQLKARVTPYHATNPKLKWTSSNKKYATVTQNGLVKVKKAGAGHRVTIQATSTDGSQVTAKYQITIMKKAVKKLQVRVSQKEVKAGKKLKIEATVSPTAKVNKTLHYTSSNTKYATVNAKGIVKTKKAGKGKTVKIRIVTTDGSDLKKTIKIKIK